MIYITDIKLPIKHNDDDLMKKIKKVIDYKNTCKNGIRLSYTISKKSIDARKKPDIYFIYSLYLHTDKNTEANILKFATKHKIKNISCANPVKYSIPECGNTSIKKAPVIVGSGPAGLFAAYILAQRGFAPIVVERGEDVDARTKTVQRSFESGVIDVQSNVQFGEGGAGTFSDGKLNTLTKDINGRNSYVLKTFADFGANDEITYVAKPHIGTDVLKTVVKNIRNFIIQKGGTFLFNTQLTDVLYENNAIKGVTLLNTKTNESFEIDTDIVLLCIGHSARDTFEMLYRRNIIMEPKSFAVGFRVQHPQSRVNKWQYGVEDSEILGLGAADYKLTNETSNNRRVYSFCMCPGGYVVNSSSEEGQMCVNGMSESKRDSAYANSAIICGINPDDFLQSEVEDNHPLKGMYYQRRIEKLAFSRGGEKGNICGQYFGDFENDVPSQGFNADEICTKGQVSAGNLRGIFSDEIDDAIIESIHKFGESKNGFDDPKTILFGIEARTSSPVRITRNEYFQCNIDGIYPCGEGAGYAGGITSAATDGLKVAEYIISKYRPDFL